MTDTKTPEFEYPQGLGWHPPIHRKGPHDLDLGWIIPYGDSMEVVVDGVENAQVVLHLICDKDGSNRKCRVGGYRSWSDSDYLGLTAQDVRAVITGYDWAHKKVTKKRIVTASLCEKVPTADSGDWNCQCPV